MRVLRALQQKDVLGAEKFQTTNPFQLAYELLHLNSITETRLYPKRMRLSQIATACPRAGVLGFRHAVESQAHVHIQQRTTFDIGNAFHRWMQNHAAYFGDRRVGWWRCLACNAIVFGFPPKKRCTCGALATARIYEEHSMELNTPLVSGHPDMFYAVSKRDIRVLEFKTVNGEEFERLTQPLSDHVFQVNGYMHYLPKDTTLPIQINGDAAFILYASKKHTKTTIPYKAFVVKKSPDIIRVIEQTLEVFTRGILDTTLKSVPPPQKCCQQTNWKCIQAKTCNVLEYCLAS